MPDASDGPIFIVGCGRSGTTLLRLMLNRHPRIAVPGETWYFPDLDRIKRELAAQSERDWRASVVDFIVKGATFPELGVTAEELSRELSEISRSEWGRVLAVANLAFMRRERKARWGDKTPGYVRHLPLIAREYPSAKILHMVRDARDVAASFFEQPFGPKQAIEAGVYWKRDVMCGQCDGVAYFGQRYLEVRYEELAADPEITLRRVLSHIGEDYDPVVLDQEKGGADYLVPDHHWHELTTKPVTNSRVGRWRDKLSSRDAQLLELEAGPLLRELGYGTETRKSLMTSAEWLFDRASRSWRRFVLNA